MKKKFLRGEITTAFTASIILGLTLFSLASQYLLVRRQTTKTKASESPYCFQENNGKKYLFFQRNTGNVICNLEDIKKGNSSNPIDAWLVRNTPCNTNSCPNNNNTWCYGNPPANYCLTRDTSCDNASCFGSSNGSGGTGGGNTSPGGTVGSGVSNGCFSLRAEFEVKDESDKKAFYGWVTFESNRGGDVKLEEAGQHVAGWNSFAGGSFTYDPNWSQHWRPGSWIAVGTLTKGQSYTVYYRGMLSGCNPQDVSLSCNLVYNTNGSASVSGNGCSCRNCLGGNSSLRSPVTSVDDLDKDKSAGKPVKPPVNPPEGQGRVEVSEICQIQNLNWADKNKNIIVNKEPVNEVSNIIIIGNSSCKNQKIDKVTILKDNTEFKELINLTFANCPNDSLRSCIIIGINLSETGNYSFRFDFNNQKYISNSLSLDKNLCPYVFRFPEISKTYYGLLLQIIFTDNTLETPFRKSAHEVFNENLNQLNDQIATIINNNCQSGRNQPGFLPEHVNNQINNLVRESVLSSIRSVNEQLITTGLKRSMEIVNSKYNDRVNIRSITLYFFYNLDLNSNSPLKIVPIQVDIYNYLIGINSISIYKQNIENIINAVVAYLQVQKGVTSN